MEQFKETYKVSIIMPVYNSEKYVKDAVNSVLNQTYNNIELIAVDDGSSDNSLEILKELSKQDSRLKVYTKVNGGISSARNYGIDRATGEYIGFIDNDDEYELKLVEENLKLIAEFNADIIKFNKIKKIIGKSNSYVSKTNFPITYLEGKQIISEFDKVNSFGGTIWNALYKTDFLNKNNIRFDETDRNIIEDHRFNLECYKKVEKMVLNPKVYYIWKMRTEHSTSGRFIKERFEQMKIEANNLYLFLEVNQIDKLLPNYWSRIKAIYLINIMLVMNYRGSGFNRKQFIKYLKELKKYNIFGRKCNKQELNFLKKDQTFFKYIIMVLFDKGKYNTLFLIARIKLTFDIRIKNRRF